MMMLEKVVVALKLKSNNHRSLAVSVITSDDIDALGADSGDELLDNIAELVKTHLIKMNLAAVIMPLAAI